MKLYTLSKFIASIMLIGVIVSCGFNAKDDNAWKKKLCEGVWEKPLKLRDGNVIMKIKFHDNGKVDCNASGDFTDNREGSWEIDVNDVDINQERGITINWDGEGVMGHTQTRMVIDYRKSKKSLEFHCYRCGLDGLKNNKNSEN